MNNRFWGRVWRGKIQNVKIIIVVTKSKFLTQFFNDVKSHDYYIPTTLCLFPQYMPGRNPKDGAKIKWHGGRAPHHHSPLYIHSIGQSPFKIGFENSSYEFAGCRKVIEREFNDYLTLRDLLNQIIWFVPRVISQGKLLS